MSGYDAGAAHLAEQAFARATRAALLLEGFASLRDEAPISWTWSKIVHQLMPGLCLRRTACDRWLTLLFGSVQNSMAGQVMNRERLAWDGAQVFVRALGSAEVIGWLSGRLANEFGPEQALALLDSWDRLWTSHRLDAPQVESGIWRAKLQDLLADNQSLAEPLLLLMAETSARLHRASDLRVFGESQQSDEPRVIDLGGYRI